MRVRKSGGAAFSSTRNSTCPPVAYLKALRAISETAVAMRVWSCEPNPKSRSYLPGSLTRGHHVVFGLDRNGKNGQAHPVSPVRSSPATVLRTTTTVTSSRPLA